MFNEREWATNDHLAAFGWLKLSKAYSPVNSVLRFFAVPSRGASSSSSNLDNRETSFSLNFIVQPGLIPMGTDTKKNKKQHAGRAGWALRYIDYAKNTQAKKN